MRVTAACRVVQRYMAWELAVACGVERKAALIKRAILNLWNFAVWRGERLEMADYCSCCEGGGWSFHLKVSCFQWGGKWAWTRY